jgi:hypothetical protein
MSRTYVADTPGNGALLARGGSLVGLALDAEVHDVVTANGAVVDDDVPSPERYRVPLCDVSHNLCIMQLSCDAHLLDLEALLVAVSAGTGLASLRLRWGRICHIDVRHGCVECWWWGVRGVDRELVEEAKCGCERCTTFGRVLKRVTQLRVSHVGGEVFVEIVLGCLRIRARCKA